MRVCLALPTEERGGGGGGGVYPPPFPSEPALAAENEVLEGRETLCDESFGFVQSLPRTEGKCVLTYVLFLGKGVWMWDSASAKVRHRVQTFRILRQTFRIVTLRVGKFSLRGEACSSRPLPGSLKAVAPECPPGCGTGGTGPAKGNLPQALLCY